MRRFSQACSAHWDAWAELATLRKASGLCRWKGRDCLGLGGDVENVCGRHCVSPSVRKLFESLLDSLLLENNPIRSDERCRNETRSGIWQPAHVSMVIFLAYT